MTEDYKLLRLFVNQPFVKGEEISLDERQAHYVGTVMRLKTGGELRLFNGIDGEWRAVLVEKQRKKARVRLVAQLRPQEDQRQEIVLAFAPIKKARLDFMVEKATELGVTRLCPILTQRTIIDRVNIERLQAACVEAAQQCERLDVPVVDEPVKLEKYLRNQDGTLPVLACCERDMAPFIGTVVRRDELDDAAIMIGPEGGFSNEEKTLLHGYPFVYKVTLGQRILRSETAALMALSVFNACGEVGHPV